MFLFVSQKIYYNNSQNENKFCVKWTSCSSLNPPPVNQHETAGDDVTLSFYLFSVKKQNSQSALTRVHVWTVSLCSLQFSVFDFLKLEQTAGISFSSRRLPPGWCSLLPHCGLLRQTETDGDRRRRCDGLILLRKLVCSCPAATVQLREDLSLQV